MRRAVFYSAGLHVAVAMVAYFGIPTLLDRPVLENKPVAVELVALEELKKPSPPPPARKPPAKKPPPPPPAVKPAPPPPPVAAPAPEPPPPPKAKPLPKQKPKPKPKPKPVAKPVPKEAPPVPPVQAAPKPRKKPNQPDQLQSLLKDLAKRKEELQREQEKRLAAKAAQEQQVARRPAPVRSTIDRQFQARRLTALVKQQIAPCWSIPAGVKEASAAKVAIQIRLNPNGSLLGAPEIVDKNRLQSDPTFRVVAESAVRALRNPRCSPLDLPYDQYDLWRDITFNFDPSEALGP